MSKYTSQEMVKALGAGLPCFPVPHFKSSEHGFDGAGDYSNLQWLSSNPAAGIFAGGTIALISLTPVEVNQMVKASVKEAVANTPVIASVGRGGAITIEMAQAVQATGANDSLRPACYQKLFAERRPEGLVVGNPLGIWRRIDSALEKD